MYDKERSRIRGAGSLEELDELLQIDMRNIRFGINLEPELKLLRTVVNRARKLRKEGKIHRRSDRVSA
jgi:hypothetical protein